MKEEGHHIVCHAAGEEHENWWEAERTEGLDVYRMLDCGIPVECKEYPHGPINAVTKQEVQMGLGQGLLISWNVGNNSHTLEGNDQECFRCERGNACKDGIHAMGECPLHTEDKKREIFSRANYY